VFTFQLKKSYVWFMRQASWNESINSLLHIQFPFILINSAPLRQDHDRSQAGAQITMHRHMGAVGAI
jgi:hypothetical protein